MLKRNVFNKPIIFFCACIFSVFLVGDRLQASNRSGDTKPTAMPEYLVKAGMLYHFAKFTKWPKTSFENSDAPVKFCVIGEDPFGPDLDSLVKYQIHGRDIMTLRLRSVRHAGACHLLFVSRSETGRLLSIIKSLARRPVLTISDIQDFASRGGIIFLKLSGSHVRFEINTGVAQGAGLSFSSKLLTLAEIILGRINKNRFSTPSN